MRRLAFVVLAGCGRLGFDSATSTADGSVDTAAAMDALRTAPCPLAASVPDPVTFSGEAFEYTGFSNTTAPVAGTVVTARIAGTQVAQTTADAQGLYALSVPTAGKPVKVEIDYAPAGYWTTQIVPDQPLDGNVAGSNSMRWRLGDGPVWSQGSIGSVYSTVGLTPDPAKGTINIAVRDCADNVVEGVVFDVSPAPQLLAYIDSGGVPNMALTSTVAPYTHAVVFNAIPGSTHITASAAGLTFYAVDIDVPPGDVTAYPVIHVVQ